MQKHAESCNWRGVIIRYAPEIRHERQKTLSPVNEDSDGSGHSQSLFGMIRVWKKVGFLWLGCPAFSCFFHSCNVYPSQNGWISVVNQATQVESGGQRNIVRHGLIHCREAIFFEHCRACVVRQCFSTFDVLSCRSVCSTRSVLFDDDFMMFC